MVVVAGGGVGGGGGLASLSVQINLKFYFRYHLRSFLSFDTGNKVFYDLENIILKKPTNLIQLRLV